MRTSKKAEKVLPDFCLILSDRILGVGNSGSIRLTADTLNVKWALNCLTESLKPHNEIFIEYPKLRQYPGC